MTAQRDELIHLIEGLPDHQVESLLADARRLAASKQEIEWPPAFVGMIKDGPTNGSSPEYIDSVLSQGFGSDRQMIVCDTGPLVALSNERDEHYRAANDMFRDLHMAREAILIPTTVLAETCYWLEKHGGPKVEAAFLQGVANGTFTLVELTSADLTRMAELVRTYASFPLGATDASVVAVAERLGVQEIATFDRRHFSAIIPSGGGHFTLLPHTLP